MTSRRPKQSSDTPVSLAGGAPRRNRHRRPHLYHSCCRAPV